MSDTLQNFTWSSTPESEKYYLYKLKKNGLNGTDFKIGEGKIFELTIEYTPVKNFEGLMGYIASEQVQLFLELENYRF